MNANRCATLSYPASIARICHQTSWNPQERLQVVSLRIRLCQIHKPGHASSSIPSDAVALAMLKIRPTSNSFAVSDGPYGYSLDDERRYIVRDCFPRSVYKLMTWNPESESPQARPTCSQGRQRRVGQ